VIVLAMVKPERAPALPKDESDVPFGEVALMLLKSFLPLALLILSVLGAIMFGIATPTEAAAVGAAGAALLAAAYRSLTWQGLRESVFLTARTSAMVCWLFVGSATFASIFAYLGGNQIIKEFVLALNLNPITFMLLSQVIIFLLGWPLEWTEIIIIFVPIFLPMLQHFGIDPILFGVLIALNLQTAFLSPPMAMSAYYLKGVSPPSVLLTQIFSGCMPFVYVVLVTMLVGLRLPGHRAVAAEPSTAADRQGCRCMTCRSPHQLGATRPRGHRRGAMSAEQLVQDCLERIREVEPRPGLAASGRSACPGAGARARCRPRRGPACGRCTACRWA
jgi:tripartite ATP-independent transporter DctM subunit